MTHRPIAGLKQARTANLHPLNTPEGGRGILIEFLLKPGGGTERIAVTIEQARGLAAGLLTLSQQAETNDGGAPTIQ